MSIIDYHTSSTEWYFSKYLCEFPLISAVLLRALLDSIALEAQTGQLVLQLQLLLRDPLQVPGQLGLRLLGHVQLHANVTHIQADFRAVLRFTTDENVCCMQQGQ